MAKGIIASLLVNVSSKGAGKTKAELKDVANTASQVGANYETAGRKSRNFYNTQDKGVIGVANSTKSFSKLAQTINGGGSSGVVGAYATLAANVFSLTALFGALKNAAQVQQVEAGLVTLGSRMGQTLTLASQDLKTLTSDALSTEQAMRSAAQVFSAGFDAKALTQIGEVARDASFALGRDMTDSMDRLTRGIIKMEPELLDELGIMTRMGEATASYARELGKAESALSLTERRTAFFNAVITEGKQKYDGLAESAGNTRAWDQLGATFKDLTKDTLNLVNTVGLPLASIFSNAPTALLGGMLMFAGTIKSQLLPGLASLQEKNQAVAETYAEMAEAQREARAKSLESLEGARERAFEKHISAKRIPGMKSDSGYHQYVDKLDRDIDSVTDGDRKTAISSLNQSLAAAEKTQAKLVVGSEKHLAVTEKIAAIHKAKGSIDALMEELRYGEDIVKINAQILKDEQRILASTQLASAQKTQGHAMEAASLGHYRTAMAAVGQATTQYNASLVTSAKNTNLLTRATIMGRTAMYGAAASARVMGIALMNMIPIVGQVLMVIGLVVAGIKALESKASKDYKKAVSDMATITAELGAKAEELDRVQKLAMQSTDKTIKTYNMQASALREMSEALEELIKKRKMDNEEAKKGGKSINEMISGVDENSKAAKVIKLTRMESVFWIGKETTALRQYYQYLEHTNPEVLELAGNLEGLDRDEIIRRLQEATERWGDSLSRTAKNLEEMKASLSEAGREFRDLGTKSIGSTSVDGLMSKLNSGMDAYGREMVNGDPAKAQQALLDLTAEAGYLLQDSLALRLQEEQTLQDLVARSEDLTAAQRVQMDMLAQRLGLDRVSSDTILTQLNATLDLVAVEQRRLILADSQSKQIQAQLSKYKESYDLTAAGVAKRIDLENRGIQLKADEVKFQATILAAQIEGQKLKISNLKLDMKNIEEEEKRLELLKSQNIERELSAINAERLLAVQIKDDKQRATALEDLDARYTAAANAANDAAERTRAVEERKRNIKQQELAAERQLRVMEAQQTAQKALVHSILLGITSEYEKQYDMNVATLRNYKEAYAIHSKMKTNLMDISEATQDINNLQTSTTRSLGQEITNMRVRNRLAVEELDVSQKVAELELQNKIVRAANDGNRSDELALLQDQLVALRESHAIEREKLVTNSELAVASKILFNVNSEGLEIQRESLEYLQKAQEARAEELTLALKVSQQEAEVARRRRGQTATESDTYADELRAATLSYKLAVEEAGVKKALIDLEFALLAAQAEQLKANLLDRKSQLALDDTVRHAQVDAGIRAANTAATMIPQAAEAAKRTVDLSVRSARATLELLTMPESISGGRWGSGFGNKRSAQAEAAQVLASTVSREIPIAVNPLVQAQEDTTNALEDMTGVLTRIEPTLEAMVGKAASGANASGLAAQLREMTPQNIIKLIGEAAQSQGFLVSRNGGFDQTPTSGHSQNSLHYRDRAIDINVPGVRDEWLNPAAKAKMEAFLNMFKGIGGMENIFNSTDHKDHGHLGIKNVSAMDMDALAQVLVQALPERFAAAIVEGAQQAATDPAVTDLGTISVNARRGETLAPYQAEPLEDLRAMMPILDDGKLTLDDWLEAIKTMPEHIGGLTAIFKELGPSGAAMNAAIEGATQFSGILKGTLDTFKNPKADFTDKFLAVGAAASSALSSIQQVYSAAAQAKIEAIDAEIAAEQKRDGKSAESLAKIQGLERKKEAAAKKAFDVNKKLMMAQSVIATATGIAQALTLPTPMNMVMASVIGAMGAAQLAIIASTSYQSANAGNAADTTPPSLTIGKRGDSVDLAKNNANAGGELAYLRGSQGYGRNASDYVAVGSAYGGALGRGYGNAAYLVGEQGPEFIVPDAPATVVPGNQANQGNPVNATFNINTLDASGVQDVLHSQRGFIIGSIREAANANGESFLENVSTDVYTKPNVGKL